MAEQNTGVASVGLDLGYQMVEPLAGERAAHHATTGTLGGTLPLTSWAAVGASLHGLYMRHPDDERGSDSSGVGYPAVSARVGRYEGPLALGCDVTGWFPGQNAPSIEWHATSVLLTALVSYSTEDSPWTYSINVGYGWDNSAAAAPPPRSLRRGDWVALGASSYDSVRAGLAVAYRNERTLFFGAFSGDWLYDTSAPATSPMRVALGVRHSLSELLHVEARGQFGLSARQDPDLKEYQPYEPRFAVIVGPRFTFGVPEASKIVDRKPTILPVVAAQPKPAAPAMPTAYELTGRVVDEHGNPLSQVQVYIRRAAREVTVESTMDGSFRFEGIASGEIELHAITVDYEPRILALIIGGADAQIAIPTIELEAQHLSAQVEGVVTAFDGKPLSAKIVLQPGAKELHTDADGNFRAEVSPGTYRVSVSADGYEQRTHTVSVQPEGVVIVNAELRKR